MLDFKLYFIANIKEDMPCSPVDMVSQAVAGGVDIIQLRYKGATTRQLLEVGEKIKPVLTSGNIPFIINDRIDVAQVLDADGVHLGQDDMPIKIARKILGPDKIIGKSTHSLEQALEAHKEDLDYFALGPVFPTETKLRPSVGLKIIRKVSDELAGSSCPLPWLVIGGINKSNLEDVLKAGAQRIAVVSAIADADNITKASWELKKKLKKRIN